MPTFVYMTRCDGCGHWRLIPRPIWADGSQEKLPDLGELSDPDLQAKFPDIPTYMGEKPAHMGLGIKRESPNHY